MYTKLEFEVNTPNWSIVCDDGMSKAMDHNDGNSQAYSDH